VVGGGVVLEVAATARSLGVEGGLCFRRGARIQSTKHWFQKDMELYNC
jgi:hypothetical protein